MRPLAFYISPEDEHIEEILKTLVDHGINTVGTNGIIWIEHNDALAVVERFGELLDKYRLTVSSCHFAGPTFNRITGSQQPVVDNMVRAIEYFKIWKPSAIVMHWGWPWRENEPLDNLWTGKWMFDELMNQTKQFGEAALEKIQAKNFKEAGKYASNHGIRIAIENMPLPWPNGTDPAQILRTAGLADADSVGICLDSGHMHLAGHIVADSIRMFGAKLFETHFHDNVGHKAFHTPSNTGDMHVPVGLGTIDWLDVISAFDEINFAGPVTFELGGLGPGIEGIKRSFDLCISNWRAFEDIFEKTR